MLFSCAAAAPPANLTCANPPLAAAVFCDTTLSVTDRASDLVDRLSTAQRISQMKMVGDAVPSLGMQAFNYGGEALHGLWSTCVANNTVCPTQFPTPISLGASFNRSLWRFAADAASTEARALYIYNQAEANVTRQARSLEGPLGLSYYAPNINVLRDGRWGRAEEVPSEDPFMNGEYAAAFVDGFQFGVGARAVQPPYIKAAAVVKHFAAYSLEWDYARHVDRHAFDANVSAQDLAETYAPAFSSAAQAGAAGIMCSYNAINGEPACTNKPLLQGLLRRDFGFSGVVATDCGALNDARVHHKRFATEVETVAAAVHAGVDSNCGALYGRALPWAVGNGTLAAAELRAPAARLLALRVRLGLFEPDHPAVPKPALAEVDSPAHRELALDAARQSLVLLQNRGRAGDARATAGAKAPPASLPPLLPLDARAATTVALVGPNANATTNLLAGYHGTPPFPPVSVLAALRAAWPHGAGNVSYERGCIVDGAGAKLNESASIQAAERAVRAADVAVVVLGLCGNNYAGEDPSGICPQTSEAESVDRTSFAMPAHQAELLERAVATGTPVVLVVVSAGPLDLAWAKQHVAAIVWAGYGGQSGGAAVVDALLGRYNPGGALPYTVVPERYAVLAPFDSMAMRPDAARGLPGRTYKYLDHSVVAPVWSFGFGLSYTRFGAAFIDPPTSVPAADDAQLVVEVTNRGARRGGIALLCFATAPPEQAALRPPARALFDFARVEELAPGARSAVALTLTPFGRSLVGIGGERVRPGGRWTIACDAGGVASTGPHELWVGAEG